MVQVITTDCFNEWFDNQDQLLQEDILAVLIILHEEGPDLGHPLAETVAGSRFKNMKELAIDHAGFPFSVFFAFDTRQRAIVLCPSDNSGVDDKGIYQQMITRADAEFSKHLE